MLLPLNYDLVALNLFHPPNQPHFHLLQSLWEALGNFRINHRHQTLHPYLPMCSIVLEHRLDKP